MPTENLDGRLRDAQQACELQVTPEISQALHGYYADHYGLASVMEATLNGSLDAQTAEAVLSDDTGTIKSEHFDEILDVAYQEGRLPSLPSAESALRLIVHAYQKEISSDEEGKAQAHETLVRCVSGALRTNLFQEASLGVTTVGEREFTMVQGLAKLTASAAEAVGANITPDGEIEWRGHRTDRSGTPVRGDSMPSGSVLVNKIQREKERFWDDCRFAGQLEFHNTGLLDKISRTGGLMPRTEQFRQHGVMGAQTAVWDKMHSVMPHFSEQFDPSSYKLGAKGEKHTGTVAMPLIRVIEAAPYGRDAQYGIAQPKQPDALNNIPLTEGITHIGVGQNDLIGREGGDRVFFASPTETSLVAPDAYKIELDGEATLIFVGDEEIQESETYGLGEGMPQQLTIDKPEDVPAKIHELQAEYINRYASMVVVPLRRGVFDFAPENMSSKVRSYRGEPTYNQNPLSHAA